MNTTNYPVQNLSDALAHAIYKGFSSFQYSDLDIEQTEKFNKPIYIEKIRRPIMQEIEVISMFPQTLETISFHDEDINEGSTTFYTIIIGCSVTNEICVYFGSSFAYMISNPNEKFDEDVSKRQLVSRGEHHIYEN